MHHRRLFQNKKTHLLKHPLRVLFLVGFLFVVNMSLTSYINSSFLGGFIGEQTVGFLYSAGSILALLGLLWMPKFLRSFGNYKTSMAGILAASASLLVFATTEKEWMIVLFFLIYLGARSVVYFSLDEFIESYSDEKTTGNTRGLYLTSLSLAWLISPFLSGLVVDAFGFQAVYTTALVFAGLSLFGVFFWMKEYKDPKYPKSVPLTTIFKQLIKKKNVYRVYRVNLLLQFFYAWMVIYVPIYLNQHLGFEWSTLGIMFAIMLLPFVLFELPLGRLADTKYGEKEIMNIGLIIMTVAVVLISLATSHNVILWTAILFFSRAGAAMVEIAVETYFFKKVDGKETDLISFYRNASPVAYLMAPLIVSVLLLLMPLEYTFFVLGLFLITGLRFSTKLVDTK
jgi:MFS family permease